MKLGGQFTYKGLIYVWDYNPATEELWMKRIAATEYILQKKVELAVYRKWQVPQHFHSVIEDYNANGPGSRVVYDDLPPETD